MPQIHPVIFINHLISNNRFMMHLKFGLTLIFLALFTSLNFAQTFSGLWRESLEKERIISGASWEKFLKTVKKLDKLSFQLTDIEVIGSGKGKRIDAVWHSGRDTSIILYGSHKAFTEKFNELSDYALVDIETYVEDRNRIYLGLWRKRDESQRIILNRNWEDFKKEWETNSKEGFKLIDIETHVFNRKERRYTGVFHAKENDYRLWVDIDSKTFHTIRKGLIEQHYRLVDYEIYKNTRGQKRYIGVWLSGKQTQKLYVDFSWTNFKTKWNELGVDNIRLIDIERY